MSYLDKLISDTNNTDSSLFKTEVLLGTIESVNTIDMTVDVKLYGAGGSFQKNISYNAPYGSSESGIIGVPIRKSLVLVASTSNKSFSIISFVSGVSKSILMENLEEGDILQLSRGGAYIKIDDEGIVNIGTRDGSVFSIDQKGDMYMGTSQAFRHTDASEEKEVIRYSTHPYVSKTVFRNLERTKIEGTRALLYALDKKMAIEVIPAIPLLKQESGFIEINDERVVSRRGNNIIHKQSTYSERGVDMSTVSISSSGEIITYASVISDEAVIINNRIGNRIKCGDIDLSLDTDADSVVANIAKLGLNMVNVKIALDIDTAAGHTMQINRMSVERADILLSHPEMSGVMFSIEIDPSVSSGAVPSSLVDPSNVDAWFSNYYRAVKEVIDSLTNPRRAAVLIVASGLPLMEKYSSYWLDIFADARAIYSGQITYKTDWWITSVLSTGAGSSTEAYIKKLANPIFASKNLDFISISTLFELSLFPKPSSKMLEESLLSNDISGRSQNIYREIKRFYETHGKRIFLGELGCGKLTTSAYHPWDTAQTGQVYPYMQSNLFLAYKEVLLLEPWIIGFSWANINTPSNPYYPIGEIVETMIKSY